MTLRSRKAIILYAGLVALVLTLWRLRATHKPEIAIKDHKPDDPPPPPPRPELGQHYPPRPQICQSKPDWLQELDIPFPVKYARRDIIVRSNPSSQRASVTKIDEPLFGDFQVVDPTKVNESGLSHCMQPLVLDVPEYAKTPPDASHILLGAASTLDRLEASISFFQRWLAYTNARLFIIISGPDGKKADLARQAEMQSHMRDLGMAVTLMEPPNYKDSFTERYFSLVKILYENRDSQTRWLGFIDDDTFVTSMSALISALSEYDTTQPLYLGALSEEWWTVVLYGLIGMGGAGIFITVPLAETVAANTDECKSNTRMGFGDHKIYECIARHTPTRLRVLPGLYQIDIHGDRSGVFESGRQILTLHHWKEGYWDEHGEGPDAIRHPRWFPMDKMSLVSNVCDKCYLQRWQFGPDTLLSNGYSISIYPGPTNFLSQPANETRLDRMERTWVTPVVVEGSNNTGWDHYVGPLRPKLKLEEEKVPYRFLEGVEVDGGVRQYYRHLAVEEGEMDAVVELFWIREVWAENSGNSGDS